MSSTRRKQNKPVKSAFISENEAGNSGTRQSATKRLRKRATSSRSRIKQIPEPVEPLRRSTRQRKKKQFFYPTKIKKRKSSPSSAEPPVADKDEESLPSSDSIEVSDVEPSSGLALLAEVSNADQALLTTKAKPSTPVKKTATRTKKDNMAGESAAARRKREQPPKYKGLSVGKKALQKRRKMVLDVDMLRKLSIAKLISKFSVYSYMKVPKDAFTTTIRHSYSCTMLPGICNEKFCGLLVDTKNQIKRHLLRHIGELLTMTTQNSQNFTLDSKTTAEEPDSDTSDVEDASPSKATDQNTVTYAIPSGTRHVTVNLPKSMDIKESSYTVIRSSTGVNEVLLLPKGHLVTLSSMVEEPKSNQLAKVSFPPPWGARKSPVKQEKDLTRVEILEEYLDSDGDEGDEEDDDDDADDDDFNDENKDDNTDEDRLVENFLKEEDKDEKYSQRKVLCNTTQFMETVVETNVLAPESQTVECDIEIRTKRKKYTKKYDLPREVGKCQKTFEKSDPKFVSFKSIEAIEPPYSDHNYAFNLYETLEDRDRVDVPHCDADGQPVSEPELSTDELSYLHQRRPRGLTSKARKPRKARTQIPKVKNKIKKVEPKPTTEEEKRNKKKALELLSVLGKKARNRKGPFSCEICGKKVTAAGTLRAHYRSHAGIKPFECNKCSATFTRLHSLKYHLMIHNEQTRFMCDHCGREFRHSSHFREHLRRHTGEEPFGCTDCPLRFKTRNTYKRHLKAKHQKKLTAKGISLIVKKE
ncbi:uncharacterized protein [Asterias amurensis]|uniref:uncharacterized protein n=1 Tax=Asterias amurensis TaxID=7602 RepID=UPI003AB2DEE7